MSLPSIEKTNNVMQEITDKNMVVSNYPGTSTSHQFKIANCKIGGIYKVVISYNYYANSSTDYRGCILAFVSVVCGYNGSAVVVRPKLDVPISYTQNDFNQNNKLSAVLAGAVTELTPTQFNANPSVFLNLSHPTGYNLANIYVKIVEEI